MPLTKKQQKERIDRAKRFMEEHTKRNDKWLKSLEKSKKCKGPVGKVFTLGVADGKVMYKITKVKTFDGDKMAYVKLLDGGPDDYCDPCIGAEGWMGLDKAIRMYKFDELF
jgi:hypothetical protein